MDLIRIFHTALTLAFIGLSTGTRAAEEAKYENDFEMAEVEAVPDDFLVLDGQFAVREEQGNKFLQLPGAPLDSFGFLFGPAIKENSVATARFFGAATGRRYPTFAIGLNGVGGYKVRVSPGKRMLELYKGDDVKTSVPLEWKPGKWTFLKISVVSTGENEWEVTGKIWQEGADEPTEPSITYTETERLPSGRAMISASPYSGKPIRFDDLKVAEITK